MGIEFDKVKDAENRGRHGVSLALADELDWDRALVWLDQRFGYDEARVIALAPHGAKLYYVAFVERGDVQRIISVRRATRKEAKFYVQNIQAF